MPIDYIIEPMPGSSTIWKVYLPGDGDNRYCGLVSLETSYSPYYGKREWYETTYSGANFPFQTKEQAAAFIVDRRRNSF